jgi:hypothetical protein
VYLGFFEARLLISRVSPAGERTAMINQNFRPAGAHWPGPVACRWHCRRGDRLNPFNDDARTIERGGEKKRDRGGWILVSGIPVSGPRERKRRPLVPTRRVPCFRRLSRSRFTFLSFCLPSRPLSLSFFTFRKRDRWPSPIQEICLRWCNGHNESQAMRADHHRSRPESPTKRIPLKS